jgi:predicted acyl esterase
MLPGWRPHCATTICNPVRAGLLSPRQLHAKLCDVAPDGSARMLVRGQAQVRDPDPDRSVDIALGHTGYRPQTGHRLRLHLTVTVAAET